MLIAIQFVLTFGLIIQIAKGLNLKLSNDVQSCSMSLLYDFIPHVHETELETFSLIGEEDLWIYTNHFVRTGYSSFRRRAICTLQLSG